MQTTPFHHMYINHIIMNCVRIYYSRKIDIIFLFLVVFINK